MSDTQNKILKKWPWRLWADDEIRGWNDVDRESYIQEYLDHQLNVTVSQNKGDGYDNWRQNKKLIGNAHVMYNMLSLLLNCENLTIKQRDMIRELLEEINDD